MREGQGVETRKKTEGSAFRLKAVFFEGETSGWPRLPLDRDRIPLAGRQWEHKDCERRPHYVRRARRSEYQPAGRLSDIDLEKGGKGSARGRERVPLAILSRRSMRLRQDR